MPEEIRCYFETSLKKGSVIHFNVILVKKIGEDSTSSKLTLTIDSITPYDDYFKSNS